MVTSEPSATDHSRAVPTDRKAHNLGVQGEHRVRLRLGKVPADVLARAKKLVASKHEARLNELLGPANRVALLEMLSKIAAEF